MSKYIALAPHYWGKGSTPDEAVKQLRLAGFSGRAKRSKNVKIYTLPEGATNAHVNGMGDLCWDWPKDYTGDKDAKGSWGAYE